MPEPQSIEATSKQKIGMRTSEQEVFARMRQEVLNRRPVLAVIQDKRGHEPLIDYPKSYPMTGDDQASARRAEFTKVFRDEVARLLGSTIADAATRHLERTNFVSTADHHGPFWHHDKLTVNFLRALQYAEQTDAEDSFIVALSCANISFDNAMLRRGLVFHSFAGVIPEEIELPLFPRSARPCPVVYYRGYGAENLKKALARITDSAKGGLLSPEVAERLTEVLNRVYGTPEALGAATFSDQVTISNFHLWKEFFPKAMRMPRMLQLEQEGVIIQLLRKHHMNRESVIGRMLFDPEVWPAVERHFNGILCGFDLEQRIGTFLFWGIPPGQRYRQQLWRNGDRLETADGSWGVALNPEAIQKAFDEKQLIPGSLLNLIVLTFYYGIKILGGSSQVFYLDEMKRAYLALTDELNDATSWSIAESVITDEMGADMYAVFLETPNGSFIQPTGLDLIAYGDDGWWKRFAESSRKLTVRQTLDLAMHEDYRFLFAGKEHTPELASFSINQAIDVLGVGDALQPCVSLVRQEPAGGAAAPVGQQTVPAGAGVNFDQLVPVARDIV